MTKKKKTTKEYEDNKTRTKVIKNVSQKQDIRKNVDLSMLQLSTGILESSPLISLEEAFYLGKYKGVSGDLFSDLKCCLLQCADLSSLKFSSSPLILQLGSCYRATKIAWVKTASRYSAVACAIACLPYSPNLFYTLSSSITVRIVGNCP